MGAMSIECAFHGFLAADAEARTSQAGKPWTRLRIGVGKDEAVQWVSVAVFGKAADHAAGLKKGDRCYIEGSIKLDTWRGNDGVERHGLSVAAFKCDQTHLIGRAKPAPKKKQPNGQASAPAPADRPNDFYDDEIPRL